MHGRQFAAQDRHRWILEDFSLRFPRVGARKLEFGIFVPRMRNFLQKFRSQQALVSSSADS